MVNQRMLLESLIESKVACEVLIPRPPSPSLTPPPLVDAGDSLRPGNTSTRARLKANATVGANPSNAPGTGGVDGRGEVPSPQAPSFAGLVPTPRDPTGYGSYLSSAFVAPGLSAGSGDGGGNGGSTAHAGAPNENVRVAPLRRSTEDAGSRRSGLGLNLQAAASGLVDSRASRTLSGTAAGGGVVGDPGIGGDKSSAPMAAAAAEQGGFPPRALGQGFREGELECECKYSRRFPMNHRLQMKLVLTYLAGKTLQGCRVQDRTGLYVYPDKHQNVFYMTLSEVGRAVTGFLMTFQGDSLRRSCGAHVIPSRR